MYLNIAFRCLVVYVFMILAIRLTGKKELTQLNTIDVILILLISNAVQNAMVGPDSSLSGGIVAAGVLFLLNFLMKKVMFRSKRIRQFMLQKPQVLIHDGKMDFEMLHKLDISNDELEEAMREHGIDEIKSIKLAMMEVDGNISIITGKTDLKRTVFKRKRVHKTLSKTALM
ncbi:protein of unknown function DUF421 [Pseudopedobacter saltans DSM 12145]|uniref:YetF C-terminal domain-containing protein n=2 Tax=Pseudopedobacter saltans TaxID=151895 RepID=F0S524_PSESL|nr:protein of unknown function DUF421 [Pseudopedobacter saltans DSM 12145]